MIPTLFWQTLALAVPYALAALGGVFSERGGVINIALEGMLLVGAFFAAVGAGIGGTPLGLAAGIVAGAGLAGLVGVNNVLGYKGYFEAGFSAGMGFMGLAVAMLGRSHPAGVLVAALLFGTLSQGALAIHAVVPKELVDVLQAVVILAVIATSGRETLRGAAT